MRVKIKGLSQLENDRVNKLLSSTALTRIETVQDMAAEAEAKSRGFNLIDNELLEAYHQAKSHKDEEKRAHARVGQVLTATALAPLDADIEREWDKRAKSSAAHTAHLKACAGTRELANENIARALRALLHSQSTTIKHLTDPPLKDAPRDVVAHQRQSIIVPGGAELRLVRDAEPSLGDDEAFVTARLAKLRSEGEEFPRFMSFGRKQDLIFPESLVKGQQLVGGELVTSPDALPLLVSLHFDELLERALGHVRAHHAAHPDILRLGDAERKARLAEIRRKVLAAERVEVAAIFAAHEAGEDIHFRAETSLEALLGIEVVRPKQ